MTMKFPSTIKVYVSKLHLRNGLNALVCLRTTGYYFNEKRQTARKNKSFVRRRTNGLPTLRSNVKVESTGHVPDAKTQEQQFFLARRIPSCLWREASKSPIRRAHGSRLISQVLLEVSPPPSPCPLLSIFTLHNYVPSRDI